MERSGGPDCDVKIRPYENRDYEAVRALYISNLLDSHSVQITRLARGIASGSVLEFANREMLADAMRGRQQF